MPTNLEMLFFYREGCPACTLSAPAFKDLEASHGNIKFVKKAGKEACQKYKVTTVPTFLTLRDGKEVGRLNGLVSYNELSNFADVLQEGN